MHLLINWYQLQEKSKFEFPYKIPIHRGIISCDTIHNDVKRVDRVGKEHDVAMLNSYYVFLLKNTK